MSAVSWYAVQTKPRREDQVVFWLGRRSAVPVFLPKLELVQRRRGRRVMHVEPLFPSYLFVRMSTDPRDWNSVRWTPGVKQIVGTGEVPVPVPDSAIELLRARCGTGDRIVWRPRLRAGAAVRIRSGPLAGLVGVLDRPASRAERVRVLINLLRTVATVEVDIVDLEEA